MTLVSTPITAKKYIEPSIAAKKTYILAQKPANGGTPAIDNRDIVKVIASIGFMRDK